MHLERGAPWRGGSHYATDPRPTARGRTPPRPTRRRAGRKAVTRAVVRLPELWMQAWWEPLRPSAAPLCRRDAPLSSPLPKPLAHRPHREPCPNDLRMTDVLVARLS